MNIRAIIFDIYGTLLDFGPPPPDADAHWRRLFLDLLYTEPRCSGLEFSSACKKLITARHTAAHDQGIPWPEVHWLSVVMEVLPELAQLAPLDQEEFLFRQIQTSRTTRLSPETAAALPRLKRQFGLLGIASNAQAYTLRELRQAMAAHRLEMDLFNPDLCFWSFEHGFSKPDPHVFQILTARLAARGISPRETLMIGDRLDNDIRPAQSHGWQTWHLGAAGDGDWTALHAMLDSPQRSEL